MKIFISGPMRGYENDNREMFMRAEEKLRSYGFDVFNPAWCMYGDKWDRKDILAIDICALSKCDCICQLNGLGQASGAQLEYNFAQNADMPILHFDGEDIYIVSKYIDNGKGAKGMLKITDIDFSVSVPDKVKIKPYHYRWAFEHIQEYTKWLDEGLSFEEMAVRHKEKHHTSMPASTIKRLMIKFKLISEENK